MLARALVRRAQVWLLDEPLSQLDSPLADKLSQDLHLLQRQFGLTIIHVTHDPNEAMALADRVGLLGEGRILQTGQPDEVYARPGSRTVGLHFGRPSINLIDGRSDGTTFVAGWLEVPCLHRGDVTLGCSPGGCGVCYPTTDLIRVGEGDVVDSRRVDARLLTTVRGTWRTSKFEDLPARRQSVERRLYVRVRSDRFTGSTKVLGTESNRCG